MLLHFMHGFLPAKPALQPASLLLSPAPSTDEKRVSKCCSLGQTYWVEKKIINYSVMRHYQVPKIQRGSISCLCFVFGKDFEG